MASRWELSDYPLRISLPLGAISVCSAIGMKRLTSDIPGRELGVIRSSLEWGWGVGQEQPEQKTNRMRRQSGPLGNDPETVARSARRSPSTPRNHGGGALRLVAGT